MSYYLGLVGAGLIFVFIVHVYNRWTIYKLRKLEKDRLFGFSNDLKSDSKNSTNANLPLNSTIKSRHRKNQFSDRQEISNFYEKITINKLESVTSENLNQWISNIINLPFIAMVNSIDKNKENKLIWDLLLHKKPIIVDDSIASLILKFKLADRKGYFDVKEIKNVREQLNQLIANTNAKLEIDEINNIAARAEALDSQCAEFDVQIVITLICRNQSGVSGGQISKESISQGMVFENGNFHKLSNEGNSEYMLQFHALPPPENLEALETCIGQKITLTLDIPKTKNGLATFQAMAKFAQHLSAAINADIVDDRLQPLSTVALETIGIQIEQIQKQMTKNGFIPGSNELIRIFT